MRVQHIDSGQTGTADPWTVRIDGGGLVQLDPGQWMPMPPRHIPDHLPMEAWSACDCDDHDDHDPLCDGGILRIIRVLALGERNPSWCVCRTPAAHADHCPRNPARPAEITVCWWCRTDTVYPIITPIPIGRLAWCCPACAETLTTEGNHDHEPNRALPVPAATTR